MSQEKGGLAEAIRLYSRASAVQFTDVGYSLLSRALQLERHANEANAISESVARSSPDFPKALKTTESLLSGK